ncbi:MAG: hypothetical protein EZS26_001756 [Candidatus Ordinivivax streblomastigis]|uniref:ComEC/Rec2-related protein domain-containing protein n=1 Tax=Candidatus Ordinivivax streblomastigis TaxID=2540710 RepID=A0A5M8P146_9BACT|nr:MAG: hypothetical protein EZS26_001756 [Candidatus Ordinivivax streblomastigis]
MYRQIPFLRFVLFFILGILVQSHYPAGNALSFVCLAVACIFISSIPSVQKQYAFRFLFGLGLGLLLFALAMQITRCAWEKSAWKVNSGEHFYQVQVMDEPVRKPKTYQCKVRILTADSVVCHQCAYQQLVVYLPVDERSENLVAGDCLWVNGSFEPAPAYLQKQSVAATGFVRLGQWSTIASTHVPFSLKLYGLSIRRILLKQLRQIVSDPDAFAIAAALMFGYRNELDANLQQSFRNIGASHILAISGAHFAILFGMLYFMLSFLGNSPKAKRLKQIIFIPLIWYFAFLTGFSPSVVRASAMLTIWGVGELLGCRAFTYNTIAVVAFFMLLFHPLYLFDVSFQLSFMAVIAILVISPRLAKGYESKNRIIQYVWQLTCVSLAAQIGVLPLSVYYFHQFPVFFLLTNFCLIPLMSVLLFFIPLSMILSAVFGNISWMLFPLRQSLQWFIDITEGLNALPFRTIDNLNLDLQGMIVFLLCIICLLLVWIRKRMVYFCYLLILLLVQWIF